MGAQTNPKRILDETGPEVAHILLEEGAVAGHSDTDLTQLHAHGQCARPRDGNCRLLGRVAQRLKQDGEDKAAVGIAR